ncbi:MAG: hypothetical protein ABSF53_07360 [Terracidiphilus sp.]
MYPEFLHGTRQQRVSSLNCSIDFFAHRPGAADQKIGGACKGMLVTYDKKLAATSIVVITLALLSACARASGLDGDAAALATLQAKADQAPPRDRCFFYAELVGQLADRAGQQLRSGDPSHASESLRLLRQYTEKIGSAIFPDSRKLKDAELLTRRASFRLNNMLRGASYEDRPTLDATLKLVYQAQTNLMIQVFKR